MVGAFGFAEILFTMTRPAAEVTNARPERVRLSELWRRAWRYKGTIGRSGVIGTAIGIIPGVGEDIGAWGSYAAAKRISAERAEFGKGSVEGLTASETGNSAVVPGSLIPTLTLGIPGSAAAAVLIAALYIHGVRPGPMIMFDQPDFIYRVAVMLVFATRRDPGLRARAHARLHPGAAGAARLADAGRLRDVRDRPLRADPAALRRLGDAGLRGDRLCPAPARLSDGAARARDHPRATFSTRACAAASR
jgi:hypothetical protein